MGWPISVKLRKAISAAQGVGRNVVRVKMEPEIEKGCQRRAPFLPSLLGKAAGTGVDGVLLRRVDFRIDYPPLHIAFLTS